jgi:orotidine-5'-phosphate decarboxylase
LPVSFLTIHLSGGKEMIEEALKARDQFLPKTKILGVSFLTSLDNKNLHEVFGIELNDLAFERLFKLASLTKIDGIVCSPNEVNLLKKIDSNIITMTPGVRFQFEIENGVNIGDQKRVASVETSLKNGSDFVVMGRSLTKTDGLEDFHKRLDLISKI